MFSFFIICKIHVVVQSLKSGKFIIWSPGSKTMDVAMLVAGGGYVAKTKYGK